MLPEKLSMRIKSVFINKCERLTLRAGKALVVHGAGPQNLAPRHPVLVGAPMWIESAAAYSQ